MRVFVVVFLVLLVAGARAVDRGNFKTCAQSAFCDRQRSYADNLANSDLQQWTKPALEMMRPPLERPGVITECDAVRKTTTRGGENSNNNENAAEERFQVAVHSRPHGITEIQLSESSVSSAGHVRYAGPQDLLLEVANEPDTNAKVLPGGLPGVVTQTETGQEVTVSVSPGDGKSTGLRVHVSVDGVEAVVANERDFLLFEPAQASQEEDSGCWPREVAKRDVERPETWNDETDGVWEAPTEPNPACVGRWEEEFKTHKDTKPRGPMSVGMDFSFPGAEHVYGIPEHAAPLSLPNTHPEGGKEPFRMYNLDVFEYELNNEMALYGHVPLMLAHTPRASNGKPLTVGVFWFNSAETWIDISDRAAGSGRASHWFSESGVVRAFILPGPTAKDVLRQYALLTGATQLPPMFALGYHQCKWNYNDEKEVAEVDAGFDIPENDMPYDVIWLDIEHTDGKRYFTWDKVHFPTPQRMIDDVSSRGRKMVTIVDPHIKRDDAYYVHAQATSEGFYVKDKNGNDYDGSCWPGGSSWVDFTNPDARAWWSELFAYDKYVGSTSALFTWNDMNEPSVFSGPEVTMHKDAKHFGDAEHRDVHNAYGLYQQMATAQGQIARSGEKERPFVLSRAFFAGTQRWGPIWTGDNAGQWEHLEASTPMILACGLGGIAFAGADVGGFFGNPEPELLSRWYQAGAFQPFFRGHGHIETKRREPFLSEEPHFSVQRNAMKQRYALLPLWYTLFFENQHPTSKSYGVPPMRPLWLEFPEHTLVLAEEQQYMIGDALLVAPVVKPNVEKATVTLPEGETWFRVFDHGSVFGAPAVRIPAGTQEVDAPLQRGTPLFQRGGSIVPLKMRSRRSTTQMRSDAYTLQIALDALDRASGSLYLDDEVTFSYQKGASSYRKFSFADGVLANTCQGTCDFNAPNAVERIEIFGVTKAPSSVTVHVASAADRTVDFEFNKDTETLTIRLPRVKADAEWSISLS